MTRKINFKRGTRRRPRAVKLAGSIYNWSIELNQAHATISRRLSNAGIVFRKGEEISAKSMFAALTGGFDMSRARKMAAEALMAELDLAEREENLIPWEDAQRSISNAILPIRQRLDALASECAHMCNPTDPEHARLALTDWVERSLPAIREQFDKLSGEDSQQA